MIKELEIKYSMVIILTITISLELLTRIYFYIDGKDINAFRKYPGRYAGSSFTQFKLNPNWELNHDSLNESINSFGFKSPEISINKNFTAWFNISYILPRKHFNPRYF